MVGRKKKMVRIISIPTPTTGFVDIFWVTGWRTARDKGKDERGSPGRPSLPACSARSRCAWGIKFTLRWTFGYRMGDPSCSVFPTWKERALAQGFSIRIS